MCTGGGALAAPAVSPEQVAMQWQPTLDAIQQQASKGYQAFASVPRFDPEPCAAAEPWFLAVLKQIRQVPESVLQMREAAQIRSGVALYLGQCYAGSSKPTRAVALLREAIQWGTDNILDMAYACLGRFYQRGLGVPVDAERALALRILAGETGCIGVNENNQREAAELMLSTLPQGQQYNPTVFALLSQGGSDNWFRLVEVKRTNSGSREIDLTSVMRGLDAGGDGEADTAARRTLNFYAGDLFLRQGERALAYAHLHHADPALARADLEELQQTQPYRLILANGQEWRATDAQP